METHRMAAQTWRTRTTLFGLGLGAISLVAGALAVQADQSVAETLTEFKFDNPNVTVQVGETAHFTLMNGGRFQHNMTIEDVDGVNILVEPDANLAPGDTGALNAVFNKPGTYQFWCPVGNHREQGMVGTITVLASNASAAPPTPAAPTQPAPAASGPALAPSVTPRARDGQSLETQSAATRASFIAVWGNQAGAEWVKEHDAALSSQGR